MNRGVRSLPLLPPVTLCELSASARVPLILAGAVGVSAACVKLVCALHILYQMRTFASAARLFSISTPEDMLQQADGACVINLRAPFTYQMRTFARCSAGFSVFPPPRNMLQQPGCP